MRKEGKKTGRKEERKGGRKEGRKNGKKEERKKGRKEGRNCAQLVELIHRRTQHQIQFYTRYVRSKWGEELPIARNLSQFSSKSF